MTIDVKNVLDVIKNEYLFKEEQLFFIGGTALAYYIEHRISEDIDIVGINTLNYKSIINTMINLGASRVRDQNESALRIAGLNPNEFMLKFQEIYLILE